MPLFDVYAGMSGGFGGACFHKTEEYETIDEAVQEAYELAIEEYQSYEGCHGIMSWEDCREDLIESGDENPTDDDVTEHYQNEIEGWIEYYAVPHTGDTTE